MSYNPGPYTPPRIEESIHPCEGLGTKYLLPWRLLDCFRTCMEEVRRRPEIGPSVHQLFAAYRDREVFPRYEGRFGPVNALSLGDGEFWGPQPSAIYEVTSRGHKDLAEVQRRVREFGVDFCVPTSDSERGWFQAIDGIERHPDWLMKVEAILEEIGSRED